jgi:hypothetical protein
MDTGDESFVASGVGLSRKVGGKKLTSILHPFGTKVFEKKEKEEEDIERREAAEAAAFAEEERTVTSQSLTQQTELERRNRRRKASVLTRNFGEPTLGNAGILGVR